MLILKRNKESNIISAIKQGACVMFDGKYRFVAYVEADEVLLVHSSEPPVIVHPVQCVLAPGSWTYVE